jgi:hypothetical protein
LPASHICRSGRAKHHRISVMMVNIFANYTGKGSAGAA